MVSHVVVFLTGLAIGLVGGWVAYKKWGVKAAGVVTAIDTSLGKK